MQVVKLAPEMGLVKLGTVAIDGTKIKANASRHKAMSYERMQQAEAELKAQIDALLDRAKSTDAAEADELQLDIPAGIERREARLKAIVEAREGLEQRQREADIEHGRSDDDECKPRDEDGNPKGGRYKREFGVPEPKAPDNFTDPALKAIVGRQAGGVLGLMVVIDALQVLGQPSVLSELNLPTADFAWALLHFNVGLELGQLMTVGAATAVLFNVRGWSRYRQMVIRGGSMLALWIAAQWFIERTAYVSLMPF